MNEKITNLSNNDFLSMMKSKAHLNDIPRAEYAEIMDEARNRIEKLEAQVMAWKSSVYIAGVDTPDELVDYIISSGSC